VNSPADLRRFLLARRPYLLDGAVALVLVLVTAMQELAGPAESKTQDVHTTFWWLGGAVMVAGLLIQHRWPCTALALAGAGALAHQFDLSIRVRPLDFGVLIILYTLASIARARWISSAALGVALAGGYLASLIHPALDSELLTAGAGVLDKVGTGPAPVRRIELVGSSPGVLVDSLGAEFGTLLLVVVAFALGDAVRSRRAHLRTLEQRAGDLEREQQQRVALATAAERARITRELHDVVAHGLSVIVMQAQGGAAVLHQHPDQAAEALRNVITTGRTSLADMRYLLGLVGAGARLVPQPGVGALPALVDRVRAAGTPVDLVMEGNPVPPPASADLTAFRIVQEALTNTIKHAGAGARASVRLAFHPDRLDVEVSDDGGGGSVPEGAGGNGLRGTPGPAGSCSRTRSPRTWSRPGPVNRGLSLPAGLSAGLEADRLEEVVAHLGGAQGVGRPPRRRAGVVALDDVLDAAPTGAREDPGEVEEALAGILEAAGLVHVLDVELPHPALVLGDQVDRVARAARRPEQVQLEVDEVGVGLGGEDVVGGPRGVVGQAEELPVVVVVAELEPGVPGHPGRPVEVLGERAPRRGRPDHLAGPEVDAEERVDDEARAERARVRQRGAPGGGVEGLRDADVARGRPQVVGVERGLELGGGPPDEAGVLDARVPDLVERGQGPVEVGGELVAKGEELNADLVRRNMATAALRCLAGERGRGERRGRADGRAGGRRRAQDAAPAHQSRHLRAGSGLVVACAHARTPFERRHRSAGRRPDRTDGPRYREILPRDRRA
jgi:signal transduction histidine kinase